MSNLQLNEYLTQGAMLESQEKYEEALEYYNKALEIDKMSHDAYISKGVVLANLERVDDAKEQFENALKVNRTSGLAYFHLGNVALLNLDMALGFENYNKAISNGFDDAQIYYNIALMHEENGEMDLALRNYTKAISKNAIRPEFRLRKAQLLMHLGNYPEALETLDELILTNPDVFEGYHVKFTALMHLRQYDKADEVISKAIELFPDDVDFMLDKCALLTAQSKHDKAFQLLKEIEAKAGGNAIVLSKLYMERAQIHATKQEADGAIAELEKAKAIAIEHNAYNYEAQFLLINCFAVKKDFEKTLEYSRELIERTDGEDYFTSTAKYYIPYSLKNLGKMDEAKPLYIEAIDDLRAAGLQSPGNLETYLLRAMCHYDLDEFDKALDLVDYVVKIKPDLPEPRLQKIAVLEAMGKKKEADEEKKAVNAMLPPDARIK